MLKDSFATAEQDMKARALAEAKVEAERMLLATRSALDADPQLLSAEERAHVDALMASLRAIAENSIDASAIEAATEALAKGTEEFAARRMNDSIHKALAGKNVEAL
jgi:molecular chaperone HscA